MEPGSMSPHQSVGSPGGTPYTAKAIIERELNRQYDFKLEDVAPITMAVKNLYIWADFKKGPPCKRVYSNKLILNDISAQFVAGTSTAILGSSGSGKTTLMNYLASRMQDSALKSNGELYINGTRVPSIKPIKQRTGYVTQFDVVYSDLSPKDHFYYTAKLSGIQDPIAKSDSIIKKLGLQNCQDTRVGNDIKRGVSGGERKRTSIGIEMITDPSLMFLDEPTTGLDSKSALNVASLLRNLADNGRTIIATIHSPSAEILTTFHKVICLCKGQIIYDGPPEGIINHFSSIGFPAPPMTNPADHLMNIIHEDDIRIKVMTQGEHLSDEVVAERFKDRLELFVATRKKNTPPIQIVQDQPVPFSQVTERDLGISAFANFFTVLFRCLLIYGRNPQSFRTKMVQTIGFCVYTIILYNKMTSYEDNTLQAILDKLGMIFTLTSIQAFAGVFSNMYTFLPSLGIFRRESQNKLYGPITYYCTHAFFELPIHFILTNVYLLIIYWIIDIRKDTFMTYLKFVIVFFCIRFAAAGLGDLLSLVLKRIEVINQSFSVLVVPLFLVSGFMANIKSIVIYMIVYSYLSPFRFGFQGTAEVEFTSDVEQAYVDKCRIFNSKCGDKSNPACYFDFKKMPAGTPRPQICSPRYNLDFIENRYLWDILILIAIGIFFRIFAVIAAVNFARETNVVNDPLPDGLVPAQRYSDPSAPRANTETYPLMDGNHQGEYHANQVEPIHWNDHGVRPVEPTLNPNAGANNGY